MQTLDEALDDHARTQLHVSQLRYDFRPWRKSWRSSTSPLDRGKPIRKSSCTGRRSCGSRAWCGACRPPESWELLYRDGEEWRPVAGATGYATEIDGFNRVGFDAVETTALRLEMQLRPEMTVGIYEWRVE